MQTTGTVVMILFDYAETAPFQKPLTGSEAPFLRVISDSKFIQNEIFSCNDIATFSGVIGSSRCHTPVAR